MTDLPLTESERGALLALARAAIRDRLFADGSLDAARQAVEITPALRAPRGAFVTLKSTDPSGERQLRGCIGRIESVDPLWETVVYCARESAFGDPRFDPLGPQEFPETDLSISALTPMHAIDGPEAIVVGRHGVVLESEGHRAVFLPQVAPEQGWTRTQLLEHLALKAGLPRDGWRTARLTVFEAEVFGRD